MSKTMATVKKEAFRLDVNDIPYLDIASIYTILHGSLFLTPAQIMIPIMNIREVHGALLACGITYDKIYEIEKGLVEYSLACAMKPAPKVSDIHDNKVKLPDKLNYSENFLDFTRLFEGQYKSYDETVTLYSYLFALFNSSPELKALFTKYNLAAGSLLRSIKKYEEGNTVFGFTLNEYKKDTEKYRPNQADTFAMLLISERKDTAQQLYDAIKTAFNSSAGTIVYTVDDQSVILGYDELLRILKVLGKEDEKETLLAMLSKISNTSVGLRDKFSLQKRSEGSLTKTKDANADNADDNNAKAPKTEIKMLGNKELLDITKDVLVRADNPYLLVLGDSGTGKTCFMQYLKQEIEAGRFETNDMKFLPYEIDLIELNARSKYRGELERAFKDILTSLDKKARQQNKIPLLLLEDMHKCVADGPSSADVPEIYSLLLNAMPVYKFAIVGTSSYDEYRLTIAKKRRFDSKLTITRIEEPSMEMTVEIMGNEAEKLKAYYKKDYDKEILTRIYDLSKQYIREKKFPSKSITVLNQVFAHAYIEKSERVELRTVEEIFERDYKVPSAMLKSDILEGLKAISDKVKKEVIGQDEAINILMRYWRIKQYGLTRPNKPIASLLFTGNTGTGKTYLAKQFAETIGYKLVRFDMSEYKESHTVSKLIGSPAGYVGHEEGGLLVNAVKSNPNCVLLLDEIEKAHRDIYNLLLQIMDNAEITSSQGEKVDFQNAVIIMTSNCGASDADKAKGIGFGISEADTNKTQQKVMQEAINRQFTPEFRGRLNSIVQFNPMSRDMCEKITDKKLSELNTLLMKNRRNFKVTFNKNLKEYIVNTAMESKAGGRSVEKSIDEVTDALLDMSRLDNLDVVVNYTGSKIELQETLK